MKPHMAIGCITLVSGLVLYNASAIASRFSRAERELTSSSSSTSGSDSDDSNPGSKSIDEMIKP